jgi:uncharacterized protein
MKIPIQDLSSSVIGTNNDQGFNPRSEVLRKGWNGFNSRALDCDILVEHDFAITVRDGTKLYANSYRPPSTSQKVLKML